MPSVNWGLLSKNAIDPETVEQAIARLITAHNASGVAHQGAGQSLEAHKAANTIDHPIKSVGVNKLEQNFFNKIVVAASLQSLDSFSVLSAETELGLSGVWINTSNVLNNQAYFAAKYALDLALYFNQDPILDVAIRFRLGINHDIYFGIGDHSLLNPGPFVGFKINNGLLKAYIVNSAGANETSVTIPGIIVTNFNNYHIEYVHGVGGKFYINNTLVAIINNVGPDGHFGYPFDLEMFNRTALSHLEALIKPFSFSFNN